MEKPKWADQEWANVTHERWRPRIGLLPDSPQRTGDPEQKLHQCGGCTYYIPLHGHAPLWTDLGLCAF